SAPSSTSPLSLHDALPILAQPDARRPAVPGGVDLGARLAPQWQHRLGGCSTGTAGRPVGGAGRAAGGADALAAHGALGRWLFLRSEEHTSELQSRENLVCR